MPPKKKTAKPDAADPLLAIDEAISIIVDLEILQKRLVSSIADIGNYARRQMGLTHEAFGDALLKAAKVGSRPTKTRAKRGKK